MSRLAINYRWVMNRFLRYVSIIPTVLSVSIIIGGGVYSPYVFAETLSKIMDTKKTVEKPIEKTISLASNDTKGDAAKDPSVKKSLRDEIIYRTNLGRVSDVKILIEKGASVDETNNSGVPLISLASSRSDGEGVDIVKLLVETKADINKTDSRGKTALFYAAKVGNKDTVEYLLANKIRYSAIDNAGNTARIIAYQTGNYEIIEILDNFVRGQNAEVRQKYQEENKEIEERLKVYNEKLEEQAKKDRENQEKIRRELISAQPALTQEAVHNLSFASCAASYWEFCNSVQQQTEIGVIGLANSINTQNVRVKEFMDKLINEYFVANDLAQNITIVSGDNIKAQLTEFSSNDERKDNGVGSIDDMTRRCNSIANTWRITTKSSEESKTPK